MREILFKGKCVKNDEWIEGIAFPHDNRGKVTMFRQHPADGSLIGNEVIPESVGQYTGFKDRNGEKIFEGAIIQNDKEKQYAVYWCDGSFALKHIIYGRIDNRFNGTIRFNSDDCNINTFEIVGNIYDDYPELLKELYNTKEINMKYDLSKFPQRLRQARKNKGITQKELENLTDIDNANISKYETGDLTPGILILIILASELNVSLDWLCGNDI